MNSTMQQSLDYEEIMEIINNVYTNIYVYQSHIVYDVCKCNNIDVLYNLLIKYDYPVKAYLTIDNIDVNELYEDITKYRIFVLPVQTYYKYMSLMKMFFMNVSFLISINNTIYDVNKIIQAYNPQKHKCYLSISF